MVAVKPTEPSTQQTVNDPNSITNLIKKVEEQKKQAESDTKYDTKSNVYEKFEDKKKGTDGIPTMKELQSIGTSFLLAAGVLIVIGAFLPKSKVR